MATYDVGQEMVHRLRQIRRQGAGNDVVLDSPTRIRLWTDRSIMILDWDVNTLCWTSRGLNGRLVIGDGQPHEHLTESLLDCILDGWNCMIAGEHAVWTRNGNSVTSRGHILVRVLEKISDCNPPVCLTTSSFEGHTFQDDVFTPSQIERIVDMMERISIYYITFRWMPGLLHLYDYQHEYVSPEPSNPKALHYHVLPDLQCNPLFVSLISYILPMQLMTTGPLPEVPNLWTQCRSNFIDSAISMGLENYL